MSSDRPMNIVVIHTDEQVFDFLGCMGHAELRTPHIDRLAAEGARFTNAYTCNGVCVPSRASLMTGRYSIGHGVACNEQRLPASEVTMGQLFGQSPYATGYFGKTHYGIPNDAVPDDGWDETFLWQRQYQAYLDAHGVAVRYPEKQEIRHPNVRYWNVGTSNIPTEHYFENVITDHALDFIQRHRHGPFLCFVGNIAPHGPFSPPEPYDRMYDPKALSLAPRADNELTNKPPEFVRWVEQNRLYVDDDELRIYLAHIYGLISLVDDNVGRLVAGLKAAGVYDNTLVVFTSDHGDFSGAYGIIGKSWCMDDRLMRTPLIMSHPAWREQRRIDALVENIDVLPTLLDVAGIDIPERMHGRSVLPLLDGSQTELKPAIFAYNEFHTSDAHLHQSMVRRGRWKLVQSHNFKGELYDLESDPNETTNLIDAPEEQSRINELRMVLLQWHIGHSGGWFDPGRAGYWEDRVNFYDTSRFTGG